MLATAWAAIPSRRPVKPSPSVVVALMLTWAMPKAGNPGDPFAHGGPIRADFRFFGNHSAIQMVDERALRAQQTDRMLQK